MARADTATLPAGVRLHHYLDGPEDGRPLVLLHGWPQTAWQWRLAMPAFAEAGYRVVAPDLRGAGHSSRPREGYEKWTLAQDIHELLHDHLGITEPAFVLGHDIGAMVAVAYALRYREDTRALAVGEAPIPGTDVYERMKNTIEMFHFNFHALPDLPEGLVTGHEREYLQHFYDKLGVRPHAVDTEHYVTAFSQPGALRAGFDLYRAFERDAEHNRAALHDTGKLTVPCLAMTGQAGPFAGMTEEMADELAEEPTVVTIPDCAHWIAEENPAGLVDAVRRFDSEARADRANPSEPD